MKKRKYLSLLLAAVFAVLFAGAAAAAQTAQERVFDGAGLFTETERAGLEQQIADLRATYPDMDVAILTANGTGGKTARDYADDFYDENDLGAGSDYSGLLMFIDMGGREVWLSGSGQGMRVFTDQRMEAMLDTIYDSLSVGDWAGAGEAFLADYARYLEAGVIPGQYNEDTETGRIDRYRPHTLTVGEVLLYGAIALLAGGASCGVVAARYSLRLKPRAYPVGQKSDLDLSRREDRFLRKVVTRQHIPRNTGGNTGSSAGRTSTHTSFSGRTHSGAGRRF